MDELISQDQHVYVQLANILRNQVHFKQLEGKIPSIRELSQLYSINFKTANKAVSLLVEEGLLHRVRGKGTYVVSSDASVSEFSLIGLILSDIINPNFGYLAQEIQEQAHDRNMSILVNTSYKKIKRLREILDMYRKRHVQAIIVQGGAIRDENCLRLIRECDIPIIGDHTHIQDIDDVWIDVRAGAQMAVTHLIENFDGPVAYVSGSDEPIEATGRFKGYRDALLGKSMKLDYRYIKSATPNYKGGFQAINQFISEKNTPRSVFLYNLVMAMGANSAIKSHGFSIPEDIAIAGCDESVDVSEMIVPTTTVAFSYRQEAKQILMLVERRLNNNNAKPLSIRIAPKLLIRSSSKSVSRKRVRK